MIRGTFERQLRRLEDELLILGSMVGRALVESVDALNQRDVVASERLCVADRTVNERRFAIENEALTLIATQQPMAGDLRVIAAVLEIVAELERIGDYAKGIARINLMMGPEPLLKPLIDLPKMAQHGRSMLFRALDAFVRRDVELARSIPQEDDQVDQLYNRVYLELINFMTHDPSTIDRATYLLWAAHNLERAADRVTNICERVVFTVTGEMLEMDVEDGLRRW